MCVHTWLQVMTEARCIKSLWRWCYKLTWVLGAKVVWDLSLLVLYVDVSSIFCWKDHSSSIELCLFFYQGWVYYICVGPSWALYLIPLIYLGLIWHLITVILIVSHENRRCLVCFCSFPLLLCYLFWKFCLSTQTFKNSMIIYFSFVTQPRAGWATLLQMLT